MAYIPTPLYTPTRIEIIHFQFYNIQKSKLQVSKFKVLKFEVSNFTVSKLTVSKFTVSKFKASKFKVPFESILCLQFPFLGVVVVVVPRGNRGWRLTVV